MNKKPKTVEQEADLDRLKEFEALLSREELEADLEALDAAIAQQSAHLVPVVLRLLPEINQYNRLLGQQDYARGLRDRLYPPKAQE